MIDLTKIVRKNILQLEAYSSARDEFDGDGNIFLDANENPYGDLNRYPDPHQKKVKEKFAELKNVEVNQIFIGNGSDEIIDLVFRTFCTPKIDKALTFSPTYGMYDVSASINDVELIKVPLTNDFQINTSAITKYIKDPTLKLIIICSPNNPTGNSMQANAIEDILSTFQGIVVIDEAYIDFSPYSSWISKINDYSNLIICQTMSKAWGLASARIGIAYSNSSILHFINKVKPPYNVSELNQVAAIHAINNKEKNQLQLQVILNEKEKLIQSFTTIACVKRIFPSDANFILIEVNDADKIYDVLINSRIVTRNRNQIIKNCLRITVGTPEENLELINTLQRITI